MNIPAGKILASFISEDFDPMRCEAALSRSILQEGLPEDWFRPSEIINGGFIGTEKLYFQKSDRWFFNVQNTEDPTRSYTAYLTETSARSLAQALLRAHESSSALKMRKDFHFLPEQIRKKLLAVKEKKTARRFQKATEPGIYRREHASLLIKSRRATVLLDPISWSLDLSGISELPYDSVPEKVDAIFISHSHTDHFHIPSILYAAKNLRTPVYVPKVPQRSLICHSIFKKDLLTVGQNAIEARWGETIRIKDIEIDILPFYGEQPAATFRPYHPDVRNWGNCFRIQTEDFSALILVDSGQDPLGDIRESVVASVKKRGPADFVLASTREFPSPFFSGLGPYWLCMGFDELRKANRARLNRTLTPTVLGVRGAAEIMGIAKAKNFLPYANGMQKIGEPMDRGLWGDRESELQALQRLRDELRHRKIQTNVSEWCVGDSVRPHASGFRIERAWENA